MGTQRVTNALPASEGFDDITTLVPAGWFFRNNSSPIGLQPDFFQGNVGDFESQAGAPDSYIAVDFLSVGGANTISNWMLTPSGPLHNGDVVSFWTRTVIPDDFPDRLQVRLSTNGTSTNVGTLATDVGDFTTLLLDINPTLSTGVYPQVWTQYTVTLSGLPGGGTSGRVGFRYFVDDGGPLGNNGSYIGIDTFSFTPASVSGPQNVDNQISFTPTTQGLTGIAGACATAGYTNQYNINVDLRNIGSSTLTNPFFSVLELQAANGGTPANPFRLRTADDFNAGNCTGGLVGTTQAIPGPISPNQVIPVNFQVEMPQLSRFRFVVSVFTDSSGGGVTTATRGSRKVGQLTVEAIGFDTSGNPILSATFTSEKGTGKTFSVNAISAMTSK